MIRVREQRPKIARRHHRLQALVLGGAFAGLLIGPLRGVLALSVSIALGVVVALFLLAVGAALVLRPTARDLIAAQPHLLRPGHRFETAHEGVHVLGVDRLRGGDVALQLSWDERHQIELDDQGLPVSVASEGHGSCTWTLSGRLLPADAALQQLQDLVGCDLSLVEHGQVEPAGPRTTRRVLNASGGVVLDLHE